jgi:hypothetical protein
VFTELDGLRIAVARAVVDTKNRHRSSVYASQRYGNDRTCEQQNCRNRRGRNAVAARSRACPSQIAAERCTHYSEQDVEGTC